MSDEDKDKPKVDRIWVHDPLPYIVRLRETLNEDSVPTVNEYRVVAYSIFEAMVQATTRAGGRGIDDIRYKIEDIYPDLEEYFRMITDRIFQKRTVS